MSNASVHVGKQHRCDFCDVKFTTASNKNAHIRKKHATEVSHDHQCNGCLKSFDSGRGLRVHQSQSQSCSLSKEVVGENQDLRLDVKEVDDLLPAKDAIPSNDDPSTKTVECTDALNSERHQKQCTVDTDSNLSTPQCSTVLFSHSTILFVPARGSTGVQDEDASRIERCCFITVAMAEFFRRGHGSSQKLCIVIPRGITDEEFNAAASCLGLVDEWVEMKATSVVLFDSYESLVSAFRQAKTRHWSTPNNVTSLLLIGHGGYDRCHVLFGDCRTGSNGGSKKASNLLVPKLSGLLDISGAKIVHLMTCKAAKLMVTMTQTKRAMYTTLHNDDTVFIAYGTQDITTVPLEFTTGKLFIRNIAYT